MKNTYFKKVQRAVNRAIHTVNRQIRNDHLFKGRFVMRQVSNYTYRYPDNSGYSYDVVVEIRDLKTGLSTIYQPIMVIYGFDNDGLSPLTESKFYMYMNDFIVEKSGFWQEKRNNG